MLRELLAILKSEDPLGTIGQSFDQMLGQTAALLRRGAAVYFGKSSSGNDKGLIAAEDKKINKLERRIRKLVVMHLASPSNARDVPYGLLLMSLVKDVERIGDYAKDLAMLTEFEDPIGGDPLAAELEEIAGFAQPLADRLPRIFAESDQVEAVRLIREGREASARLEDLWRRIASAERKPETHAALLLGAQFYRRIFGHLLNLLSSVVVPLHKLDYYDDKDMLGEVLEQR